MSIHSYSPPLPQPGAWGREGVSWFKHRQKGWRGSTLLALVDDGNTNTNNNHGSHCSLSIYYVPDTQLRTLTSSCRLILPEVPGGKCAFPEEDKEAQRGTDSRSHSQGSAELGLEPMSIIIKIKFPHTELHRKFQAGRNCASSLEPEWQIGVQYLLNELHGATTLLQAPC